MKKGIKIFYISFLTIILLIIIIVGIIAYLYFTSAIEPPIINQSQEDPYTICHKDGITSYGPNKLKKNKYGIYEIYIEGNEIERGNAYGILLKDLLYEQEKVFVNKLYDYVPNEYYLKFLRILLRIGMRGVTDYIPEEYCRELYAMSKYCSTEFNWIGSPYERQVNYHAAHDIGHAMQDYMLVGCSSFGCWNNYSNDSNLIIGRNFDFYISDEFAKNKLITICKPEKGFKFISVSWPGMIGVLSAMNSEGITVTINAAKGEIPTKTAMPITLLARQIIQYASNIDEAYKIAKQYQTFVSESILIGSASENKAAIIEKTTDDTEIYYSDENYIICTNHYQSDKLKMSEFNLDNIKNSDSKSRYDRVKHLISKEKPISINDAANILRNPYENDTAVLKLCSECAINQFIAHHSVIFQPKDLAIWISTSPWQLGEYICYQLSDSLNIDNKLYNENVNIKADSIIFSPIFNNIITYRKITNKINHAIRNNSQVAQIDIENLIKCNPYYFQTYETIGDYYKSQDCIDQAKLYWEKAIHCNPGKLSDKNDLINKLK